MSLSDEIQGLIDDQRALDAEVRCSRWLADGNAARERGELEKAERCYRKAQFWLDRYNKLAGRGP